MDRTLALEIATLPLDWWLPPQLRRSWPWQAFLIALAMLWAQTKRAEIRWRNEVVNVRRINRTMEFRRRQWLVVCGGQYTEEAREILRRTRARYPWTQHAYAMPASRNTYTISGAVVMGAVSMDSATFAQGPFVDVTFSGYATLQNAVTAAGGGVAYFPPGYSPTPTTTVTVPANTTLHFAGTTITCGATIAGGIFSFGANCKLEGKLTYVGGAFTTSCFRIPNTSDGLHADLNCAFSGIANPGAGNSNNGYLFAFEPSGATATKNHTIDGLYRTTDSLWVRAAIIAHADISGLKAGPMTADCMTNSHRMCEINTFGTATGTIEDVKVHHCSLDGGARTIPETIFVIALVTAGNAPLRCQIDSCVVSNFSNSSLGDGCDIIITIDSEVSNCAWDSCNNGTNVSGGRNNRVVGCNASGTLGAGFRTGDPTVLLDTSLTTFTGCTAYNCGIGAADFNSSGFLAFAPTGQRNDVVNISGCDSYGLGLIQKYGVAIQNSGTGMTNVTVAGGSMIGLTAAFLDPGNIATFRGVNNITGMLPTTPAVSTPITNTTGTDIFVSFIANAAGTTFTVDTKALAATPANAQSGFVLRQRAVMSYVNAPASWAWVALD